MSAIEWTKVPMHGLQHCSLCSRAGRYRLNICLHPILGDGIHRRPHETYCKVHVKELQDAWDRALANKWPEPVVKPRRVDRTQAERARRYRQRVAA